jgi:hypothetical protein
VSPVNWGPLGQLASQESADWNGEMIAKLPSIAADSGGLVRYL